MNARHYLQNQMYVHAQDTATSLGLSLTTATEDGDVATIESMLDVIFDRGYYSHIYFNDLKGKKKFERAKDFSDSDIPQWFIALVKLPRPYGNAEVLSGWQRIGELTVISHPGYAYRDLWHIAKEQALWFSFVTVITILFASFAVRYLLAPLNKVVQQADAICERNFVVLKEIPRTRELRRVVEAMNRMAEKTKVLFTQQVDLTESLFAQARLDPVTKLSNRRDFDSRFSAYMHSEEGDSSGALILVQIKDFSRYNEIYSREQGDELLLMIAEKLTEVFEGMANVILARRAGADFTAFLPQVTGSEAEEILDSLYVELVTVHPFNQSTMGYSLHIGLAYSSRVSEEKRLLQKADMALRAAQKRGPNNYQIYHEQALDQGTDNTLKDALEWRQVLQQVLADRSLVLHFQPVFSLEPQTLLLYEVLCRIEVDNQLVTAGVFLPMAERYGLLEEFDQLIIDLLIEQNVVGQHRVPFSVNLSLQSIQSDKFVRWLQAKLLENNELRQRIVLEVPEYIVRVAETPLKRMNDILVPLGVGFSIDHFGSGAAAFSYLASLQLQFLKVDRNYVEDIDSNPDNRFFIRSVEQIAQSKDICLLVEGVESEAEWQTLKTLNVGGAQGYFLGRPSSDLIVA